MSVWDMDELLSCINKIINEIEQFDSHWICSTFMGGETDTPTIQEVATIPKSIQSKRKYNIKINTSYPMNYTYAGLTKKKLVEIAYIHEKTHGLCDLSYTSNNAASRLGTWNAESKTYDVKDAVEDGVYQRVIDLDAVFFKDKSLSAPFRAILVNRIGYASNLVDFDTVVNELCVVCAFCKPNTNSKSVRALIDLAKDNLLRRALGRSLQ
jgi:hypothetical protein